MKPREIHPSDVTIIIPTLNEERGIGGVIEGFKKLGYTNILVIDGNSTDRTREIAREKGARVIVQSGRGKGQAVAEAFKLVDTEIVVLIDGDGTYDPNDVNKLLEPIQRGVAEHVMGNRLLNFEAGAFNKLNFAGNKILNWFFRFLYGVEVHDILTGYRALTREVYKNVDLDKHGFEIEAELVVETLSKGYRILEVPITYRKREGDTKLSPMKDGLRIGRTIFELLTRYNPAKYLYLLGIISMIAGIISGLYVVHDWMRGITHYLLVTLTAILVLGGLQLVMFGFVSSYLFKMMVDIKRSIREIKK